MSLKDTPHQTEERLRPEQRESLRVFANVADTVEGRERRRGRVLTALAAFEDAAAMADMLDWPDLLKIGHTIERNMP